MKVEPFSIKLDASNYEGLYKMFPIPVRLFDIDFNQVMTKLLDIYLLVKMHQQHSSNLIAIINYLTNLNLVGTMSQVSV